MGISRFHCPLVPDAIHVRPLVFGALAFAFGCDTPSGPPLQADIDVRKYLAPNATATIDARGMFVFSDPIPQLPREQISPPRALELAAGFLRTYARFHEPLLEEDHGAPIAAHELAVGGRAYYARSPYDQSVFPPTLHPGLVKASGPRYLVPMLLKGQPAVSLAVSAYNTDVVIRGDGRVGFPIHHGSDFYIAADRGNTEFDMPVSPERAVEIVARELGGLAIATPELLLPGKPFAPQFARWRVRLDRPTTVQGAKSGRILDVTEAYVGRGGSLEIPLPTQSLGTPVKVYNQELVYLRRISDVPTEFEPARRSQRNGAE